MRLVVQFIVIILLFSSCVKNNPDPSWLEVNEWTLNSNVALSGEEGELTHRISNAKVYVDDDLLGIFEVPFRIPVLKSGYSNIKIYPVVINNGISASKIQYPFLNYYETNADLIQNEVLELNPVTTYKSVTNFWIEDFEDINNAIDHDLNSACTMVLSNENLNDFNGNFYGKVVLNENDSSWVAYTTTQLAILNGAKCFLELDYYVTNDLYTGLVFVSPGGSTNNPNIRLNSQEPDEAVWKKIYIELSELVAASSSETNFLQSFTAFLDEGDTEGIVLLDNIKVLWY